MPEINSGFNKEHASLQTKNKKYFPFLGFQIKNQSIVMIIIKIIVININLVLHFVQMVQLLPTNRLFHMICFSAGIPLHLLMTMMLVVMIVMF